MPKILLTGGTGQIGWELRHTLSPLGEVIAPPRNELDLASPDSVRAAVRQAQPDIIVNAAAFSSMDEAEAQPDLALRLNASAPAIMAEEARRLGALMVHYSSAYVFDGEGARPYVEDDTPNPITRYGRTKLAGEQAIAGAGAQHIILRLSWIHSLRGTNFLTAILKVAREKPEIAVVVDQIGSPTWARTVAQTTAKMLEKWRPSGGPAGIFHLSAAGMVSRCGFAGEIIAAARRVTGEKEQWARAMPVASSEYRVPAARPKYCVLDNARIRQAFGIEMPEWRDEVMACMSEFGARAAHKQ